MSLKAPTFKAVVEEELPRQEKRGRVTAPEPATSVKLERTGSGSGNKAVSADLTRDELADVASLGASIRVILIKTGSA